MQIYQETVIVIKGQLLEALSIKGGIWMNTLEIKKMSTTDRLQILGALWNSFMEEDYEIDSPHWHEDILEERKTVIHDKN